MKLSEVIKAIEDGSKNKFENGFLTLKQCEIMRSIELSYSNVNLAINFDDWEEVKPHRQWSEKELILFKLLPDWAKWISKDGDDDSVFVFSEIPEKRGIEFKGKGGKMEFVCASGTVVSDILTITFEESPIYIGDLKGE